MLGLSIDEIQTTKDFEILGHIAEVRRLMGIALAPQVADYAADFLEGSDEKLCIFAWHLEVLDIFEQELSRFGTVRIDGRKSPNARQKAVDDFWGVIMCASSSAIFRQREPAWMALQKVCSRCYLAEPDWVPAQNEQAVSRLDRIGQENLVSAEIFVAPGSISEKILVKALEKMNVIHRVLDQKENDMNTDINFRCTLASSLPALRSLPASMPCSAAFRPSRFGRPTAAGSERRPVPEHRRGADLRPEPNRRRREQAQGGDAGEVDAHGHPWSADLHAATKGKTKDGLWRMKVGVSRPAPLPGFPVAGPHWHLGEWAGSQATGSATTAGASSRVRRLNDEDDEFAAFRAGCRNSDAKDAERRRADPRPQVDRCRSRRALQPGGGEARRSGAGQGDHRRIHPRGHRWRTAAISPRIKREAFAKAVEAKAGIEFAG
jgi:hypothetical protein